MPGAISNRDAAAFIHAKMQTSPPDRASAAKKTGCSPSADRDHDLVERQERGE